MNKAIIKHTPEGNILILDEKMPGNYSESCRIKKEYQLTEEMPTIDWEQRRYELAKEFEAASLANPEYSESRTMIDIDDIPSVRLAKISIRFADALIEELRKTTIHHDTENI